MSNHCQFCLVAKRIIFGVASSNSKSNIFGTGRKHLHTVHWDLIKNSFWGVLLNVQLVFNHIINNVRSLLPVSNKEQETYQTKDSSWFAVNWALQGLDSLVYIFFKKNRSNNDKAAIYGDCTAFSWSWNTASRSLVSIVCGVRFYLCLKLRCSVH